MYAVVHLENIFHFKETILILLNIEQYGVLINISMTVPVCYFPFTKLIPQKHS